MAMISARATALQPFHDPTCNTPILAAAAIHRSLAREGLEELRGLFRSLPDGTEAVVGFVVSGTKRSDPTAKVYSAVHIYFNKKTIKEVRVEVSMAAYAKGSYQEGHSPGALVSHAFKTLTTWSRDTHPTNSELVKVVYYPCTFPDDLEKPLDPTADKYSPLMLLTRTMKRIFHLGIPLPLDSARLSCQLTAACRIPDRCPVSIRYRWEEEGEVERRTTDPSSEEEFAHLVRVARGEERPKIVPKEAVELMRGTRRLAVDIAKGAQATAAAPALPRCIDLTTIAIEHNRINCLSALSHPLFTVRSLYKLINSYLDIKYLVEVRHFSTENRSVSMPRFIRKEYCLLKEAVRSPHSLALFPNYVLRVESLPPIKDLSKLRNLSDIPPNAFRMYSDYPEGVLDEFNLQLNLTHVRPVRVLDNGLFREPKEGEAIDIDYLIG